MTLCQLSLPLASLVKRLEKQYHFFHTKLISHAAYDWSCKFSLIDLRKLYHPTKWVVSGSD